MCSILPEQPLFSIVVPTFRRPEALSALLSGIGQLRFPRDLLEVIIVDDSGDDDLEPILGGFRECYPVITLRTPHLGPAPARQAGIDIARGKYLAFTDDDCIPDSQWLSELQYGLEMNPDSAVGGAVLNGLPKNIFSTASQFVHDYIMEQWSTGEVEYIGTGNVAYPAAAFRVTGGLDRGWNLWGGEDRELCRRWRASGHKFIYRPTATVRHFHPLTLATFWNQHYRYGRGAARFYRAFAVQKVGFYTGLLAAGCRRGNQERRLSTAMLILVSQAATACGFLVQRLFPRPA